MLGDRNNSMKRYVERDVEVNRLSVLAEPNLEEEEELGNRGIE